MLNIFDYIENYCRVHNIKAKSFKSSVLTKDKLSEKLTFAPGIAFFYKLRVTGEIQNIANFGKPFMTVDTQTDYWDFSKLGNVYDDGALQKVLMLCFRELTAYRCFTSTFPFSPMKPTMPTMRVYMTSRLTDTLNNLGL